MPSTATITAFYSFTANTKARATQVNNNFDVFRGHIIPVHVSTVTSADNTYDLGSLEYRWRNLYLSGLNTTATSSYDFKVGGSTIGSIKSGGYQGLRYNSMAATTTAAREQIAVTAGFNFSVTGSTIGSVPVPGSTLTISTIGRPVRYGLISDGLGIITFSETASGGISFNIELFRNNVTVSAYQIFYSGGVGVETINPLDIEFLDLAPTLTAANYHLSIKGSSTARMTLIGVKAFAYEQG